MWLRETDLMRSFKSIDLDQIGFFPDMAMHIGLNSLL
jgi:hypothetical protein